MKNTNKPFNLAAATFWLTAFLMQPLTAQTNKTWDNTDGGDYATGGNWSPTGVPGTADTLIFDLDSTYQVDFGTDRTAAKVSVRDGNVSFNVGMGNTLTLTDETTSSIEIGLSNAIGPSSLSLISGTTDIERFYIGEGGNTGTLNVSGANTVLNALLDTSIVGKASANSSGTLNISGGATVNTGRFVLSDGAGTGFTLTGAVNITGTGSSMSTSGPFIAGRRSGSNVNVSNGGALSTDTGGTNEVAASLIIGEREAPTTVVIDNATLDVSQSLRIADGGASAANGQLDIINGASVTVANELVVNLGTGAGHAEMLVSGSGTTLQVNSSASGSSWIGGRVTGDTASGRMVVADGASVSFTGPLNVRQDGKLVIDGASVSASSFFLRQGDAEIGFVLNTGHFAPLLTTTGLVGLNQDGATGILDLALAPDFSADLNDTFTLIAYGGNLNGTFDGYSEGSTITSGAYAFELSYGTGNSSAITLTTTAIPEPAHFAVLFGVLAAIMVLRRKMRSKGGVKQG